MKEGSLHGRVSMTDAQQKHTTQKQAPCKAFPADSNEKVLLPGHTQMSLLTLVSSVYWL